MRWSYRFGVLGLVIMLFTTAVSPAVSGSPEKIEQDVPEEGEIDVGISNLTFSKDNPREGENITIFVTVMNNESVGMGDLPFIDEVNITLMHFEDFLFAWENVTVDANSTKTFEFSWRAKSGVHSFTALMIFEIEMLNMSLPWSRKSAILEVDPDPIGNLYFPMMMLVLVFGVLGIAVVAPACFDRLPYLETSKKKS
ncbi:MAG: hypothetical protein V5A88_07960 [Candidatus Thermoplasmatota archaeon]